MSKFKIVSLAKCTNVAKHCVLISKDFSCKYAFSKVDSLHFN